jgi:methyl-accepting chemotaxis protein
LSETVRPYVDRACVITRMTVLANLTSNLYQHPFKCRAMYDEQILGDEGHALVKDTLTSFKDWKPIWDEVLALLKEGRQDEAAAITKARGAQQVTLVSANVEKLRVCASNKADSMYQQAEQTRQLALTVMGAALALALIVSVGLALWMANRIARRNSGDFC